MPAFSFLELEAMGGRMLFSLGKKYDPIYYLQTMKPRRKMDKVGLRKNIMNNTNENSKENHGGHPSDLQGDFYEIQIKGHLDESWSDWLEGLEVRLLENGEMILCGRIGDQAALMGILTKLYGLNLTLLSVSQVSQKK